MHRIPLAHVLLLCVLLVGIALLVGGCGGGDDEATTAAKRKPTISGGKVEARLRESTSDVGISFPEGYDITCPKSIAASSGTRFTCTVKNQAGGTYELQGGVRKTSREPRLLSRTTSAGKVVLVSRSGDRSYAVVQLDARRLFDDGRARQDIVADPGDPCPSNQIVPSGFECR